MVRPTTSPRGRPATRSTPGDRSFGHIVAVAASAGLVAIGALLLFDPARRLGLDPTTTLGFATSIGSTVLLFGAAFAVLSPVADVVAAWVRATPESERRNGSGDGGFVDFVGFGDADCGGDGGGCGD